MITIVQKDAPVLRAQAEPVNPKDFGSPQLKKILADMQEALEKEEDGVAIAAPQIGVPLRIFIVSHRAFEFADEEAMRGDEGVPARKNGCPRGASRSGGCMAKFLARTKQPCAHTMKTASHLFAAEAVSSRRFSSTRPTI